MKRHVWTRAMLHAWNLRQRGQLELPLKTYGAPAPPTRGTARTGRAVPTTEMASRPMDGLPVIITKARSVR